MEGELEEEGPEFGSIKREGLMAAAEVVEEGI
jgi:hypothetical protein